MEGVKLRNGDLRIFTIDKSSSKFGDITFKNTYSRFLNFLDFLNFDPSFEKFKTERMLNKIIYSNTESLWKLFLKFYFYYFTIKKLIIFIL